MSESQGLELLTVPQSHGSQGPSHSFKYKGANKCLKGSEGNARKTCATVRRGITAVQKKSWSVRIQNRRAKIEKKEREKMMGRVVQVLRFGSLTH